MRSLTGTRFLKLELITADAGVQARDGTHAATVKEYTAAMKAGDKFPAGRVYRDTTNDVYWLARGFHRFAAATAAGLEEMEFEVWYGDRKAAIIDAIGDNDGHGRRRTNKDKERSVRNAIAVSPEWSNREVAAAARVTDAYVGKIRRKIQTDALQTVSTGDVQASEQEPPDYAGRVRQLGEKFGHAASLARQLRKVLHELLESPQGGTYLRVLETVTGTPLFAETPRIRRGNQTEGGWDTPWVGLVIAAIEQARVDHACAACGGKGCSACRNAGYVPKDLRPFVDDKQQLIDFTGGAA